MDDLRTLSDNALSKNERIHYLLLQLLQSRLRPHFYFNLLNNVSGYCYVDVAQADHLLNLLARYQRYIFSVADNWNNRSFHDEKEQLKRYMELQQSRMGDGIKLEWQTEVDNFYLPPLALDILVENAISHGLCPIVEGGTVKVHTYEAEDSYIIAIEDNGLDLEHPKRCKDVVDMQNIDRLLRLLDFGRLSWKSGKQGGLCVDLELRKTDSKD